MTNDEIWERRKERLKRKSLRNLRASLRMKRELRKTITKEHERRRAKLIDVGRIHPDSDCCYDCQSRRDKPWITPYIQMQYIDHLWHSYRRDMFLEREEFLRLSKDERARKHMIEEAERKKRREEQAVKEEIRNREYRRRSRENRNPVMLRLMLAVAGLDEQKTA